MKHFLIGAVLLLACAQAVHADEVREAYFAIGADVDAGGHVTATEPEADVPAPLAKILEAAVRQWQFVPATVNGQAVAAHTFVKLKLRVTPDTRGGHDVRIIFQGNGPRLAKHKLLPKYPVKAVSMGRAGFVYLDATVQPDGHLSDMKVSNRFEEWPADKVFYAAVLAAARHWNADPEQVEGKPVATRLRIPVNFTLTPPNFTARQLAILRADQQKEAAEDARAGIPLPSEQEVALDSPLQPSRVATIIAAP